MDEQNIFRLRVLERTEAALDEVVEEKVMPKFSYPHQTNPRVSPILKKMVQFHNEKIGDKFSIRDLLR